MVIHIESVRIGIQFALGSQGIWTPELEDLIVEEIKKDVLSKLHQPTVRGAVCDCGKQLNCVDLEHGMCHKCWNKVGD